MVLAATTSYAHATEATYYADRFENRMMANHQRYHATALTAASRDLPLGVSVWVATAQRRVRVRITDRPRRRHALDLSRAAFRVLAPLKTGWISVQIRW